MTEEFDDQTGPGWESTRRVHAEKRPPRDASGLVRVRVRCRGCKTRRTIDWPVLTNSQETSQATTKVRRKVYFCQDCQRQRTIEILSREFAQTLTDLSVTILAEENASLGVHPPYRYRLVIGPFANEDEAKTLRRKLRLLKERMLTEREVVRRKRDVFNRTEMEKEKQHADATGPDSPGD